MDWLFLAHPQPRTWPETQACVLTRNPAGSVSAYETMPKPPSHSSQGTILLLTDFMYIYTYTHTKYIYIIYIKYINTYTFYLYIYIYIYFNKWHVPKYVFLE